MGDLPKGDLIIQKDQFDPFFDSAPIGIIIVQSTIIVEANKHILQLYKYTNRNQLIGKEITVIQPPGLQQKLTQLGLDRERGEKVISQYETRGVRSDNTEFPILVHASRLMYCNKPGIIAYITDLSKQRRIEQSLIEVESKFQRIVNQQTEFIVRWQPGGIRTYVNPAYCKYFGISEAEALGSSFLQLISGADRKKVEERLSKLSRERPTSVDEHRVLTATGEVAWNQWVDSAIYDDKGNIIEYQSVGRDITPLKQAEETLIHNELLYRSLFEQNPTPSMIHDFSGLKKLVDRYSLDQIENLDTFFTINPKILDQTYETMKRVHVNSAFLKMLGLKDEAEFIDEHPTKYQTDESVQFFDVSRNEFIRGAMSNSFKTKLIRKDNSLIDVIIQRTIDPNTILSWEKVYTSIIDITELVEARKALETSEIKYRSLFELAHEPTFLVDIQTLQFKDCNELAHSLLEYTRKEFLELKLSDIIAKQEVKELNEMIKDISTGKKLLREFTYVKKDSSTLSLEMNSKLIEMNDGHYILIYAHDTSQRKEIEMELRNTREQLFQAQKMEAIGRMAGTIAHDFNNQLMFISLNAQILSKEFSKDTPQSEALESIHTGINKAADITSDLLLFSRNRVMKEEEVEVNSLISQFFKSFRPLVNPSINLEISYFQNDLKIYADANLLEQVIMNIIINAIDAMPNGGNLAVETNLIPRMEIIHQGVRNDSSIVQITITDSGEGMSEETMQRIFDPFFTTKEEGKGTGLGLASAYTILEQFKGFIEVESLLGSGTTLNICIPELKSSNLIEVTKQAKKRGPKKEFAKVLVIDDDARIRSIIAKILNGHNIETDEASGGDEALNLFRANSKSYDLVISDISMPGMSGPEIIKIIHTIREDIPVIYITGFTTNFIEISNARKENERILQKPFRVDNLLQHISDLVAMNL